MSAASGRSARAAQSWQARSIAAAAAHPLGVGDALYRFTEKAQEVDTVPFGAFRRALVEKVGYFDEDLLTNEDYELTPAFADQAGRSGSIRRSVRCIMPGRIMAALARQYWRYGFWKARMLRRYPGTLRWRQALPPLVCAQHPWPEHSFVVLTSRGRTNRDRIGSLCPGHVFGGFTGFLEAARPGIDLWRSSGDCNHASRLGERIFMEYDL